MSTVTCHIAMSLDGFVAGPNQSPSNPIGEGGLRLHQWAFATDSWRKQTDGIDSALEQAHAAAGDRVVSVAGGASTVQQCLAAGMLDELYLHIVPIILGAGERLLENVGDPTLEPINVIASPAVTHVRYHVAS